MARDPFPDDDDDAGQGRKPWPLWAKLGATASVVALVGGGVFLVRHAVAHDWFVPQRPARVALPANAGGGFSYPNEGPPRSGVQTVAANQGNQVRAGVQGAQGVQSQGREGRGGNNPPNPITSDILGLPFQQDQPAPPPGARTAIPTREAGEAQDDALARGLRATRLDGVQARELPDPTFTVGMDRPPIPCRLQTAMNTRLPGTIRALIGENILGDTGAAVALDAGSTAVGTVARHTMDTGVEAAFVLWQTIRTPTIYDERGLPHRYAIEADSPAGNEMGEAGMEGTVDRHYRTKIPALIGVSLLQSLPAAASAAVSAGTNGYGTGNGVALNFVQNGAQGVRSAADAWLDRILSQADTVRALAGSNRCSIVLARDLDFNPIYRLKLRNPARNGLAVGAAAPNRTWR